MKKSLEKSQTIMNRIKSLTRNSEESDFLSNILGTHYLDVKEGRMQVVLFGAGSAGQYICNGLKIHNVTISCFCDNNPQIISDNYLGFPVISVEELIENYKASLIVISVSWKNALKIKEQLLQLGISVERIHIPLLEPLLFYTNAADQYWSLDDLNGSAEKIQKAYDLFEDIKSKELFINRIALTIRAFDYKSFQSFINKFADLLSETNTDLFSNPHYDENYFYFNSDFFSLKDFEVFANVGALVGDCALEFAKSCSEKGLHYKEIINFEPDPNNFEILLRNTNSLDNVRCVPYGLWSHKARLNFSNPNWTSTGNVGRLDNNGDFEVNVASMDELLHGDKITFMKMDIEGAEVEALRGAAETIKRNKPKLAISVYHKRNDIFEIPLLINSICPDYKFYLRHYSTTFSETVLFAVPNVN